MFSDPLPKRVQITLFNGDALVAETLLAGPERTERHEVYAYTPNAAERPKWRIVASPPVPGLAYALALRYRVPWTGGTRGGGSRSTPRLRDG